MLLIPCPSCRKLRRRCHTTSSTACGVGRCRALYDTHSNTSFFTILTAPQCESALFWGWLGGFKYEGGHVQCGRLLTIEELGEIFKSMLIISKEQHVADNQIVPVNLKDRDEFHLSLEEYLQSLITLVEELVRHPWPPLYPQTNNVRPASHVMPSLSVITSVHFLSINSSRTCTRVFRCSTSRTTACAAVAMGSSTGSRMWRT